MKNQKLAWLVIYWHKKGQFYCPTAWERIPLLRILRDNYQKGGSFYPL